MKQKNLNLIKVILISACTENWFLITLFRLLLYFKYANID